MKRLTMLKRLWNWLRRLTLRRTPAVVSSALLAGVEPKQPEEEKWNPCKWRGTKWVTLRPTSTGAYAEIWYELDRNKEGRVTVIPPYGWDEEKRTTKNNGHWTTLDKKLSELLPEEQASEKLLASKDWHPATMIMCGCKPANDRTERPAGGAHPTTKKTL